ncbi:hypothetical protein [Stutzerimonas nosocomialis]|uniref:hypothetical protein n=1 Tax=Stutzerimonas nosocomialis TaxID=1056496 RepID=UPI001108AB2F|nr:hypothetical protein [Stutzerimonas nosocomialis]
MKYFDFNSLVAAFAIGCLVPFVIMLLTITTLNYSKNTSLYIAASTIMTVVCFIYIPVITSYIAAKKSKQLPCCHGLTATGIIAMATYALSEPVQAWIGIAHFLSIIILGLIGTKVAVLRRQPHEPSN